MTYIRREQFTSHETKGRVGCEMVETYIATTEYPRKRKEKQNSLPETRHPHRPQMINGPPLTTVVHQPQDSACIIQRSEKVKSFCNVVLNFCDILIMTDISCYVMIRSQAFAVI